MMIICFETDMVRTCVGAIIVAYVTHISFLHFCFRIFHVLNDVFEFYEGPSLFGSVGCLALVRAWVGVEDIDALCLTSVLRFVLPYSVLC